MSKTVYGIFAGYYSDWRCIGYCSSKDEAEKRVAKQNTENSLSGGYLEDEYIMEIPCLDGKIDVSDVAVCYIHEVMFCTNDNWKTHEMIDQPNNYKISLEPKLRCTKVKEYPKFIIINVPLRTGCNDRKLAEKIAQDEFYAYLYQRRNINGE